MERKVAPLTEEEIFAYCDMHEDCITCSGDKTCPRVSKILSEERIEEIRMKLIKG